MFPVKQIKFLKRYPLNCCILKFFNSKLFQNVFKKNQLDHLTLAYSTSGTFIFWGQGLVLLLQLLIPQTFTIPIQTTYNFLKLNCF